MFLRFFEVCLILVFGLLLLFGGCELNPKRSLVLATTTSTYDSGLLDAIIPGFEEEHNVSVRVVSVGTGQALALASRGDADVVLVHAPDKEMQFIEEGFGIERTYVMYNDFVILGPSADPAEIRSLSSAAEAFRRIAEAEADFASRGDESGTHIKELIIWGQSGMATPEEEDWYLSLGQGMGGTLTAANEKRAYVLSDRGTYLSRTDLELEVMVERDEILFNPYHVMIANPDKFPDVQVELSQIFIDYLVSEETQRVISEFGMEKFGQPLFTPVNLDVETVQ